MPITVNQGGGAHTIAGGSNRSRGLSPLTLTTAATRCHILKLKCTKFDFSWGSAPDPAGGAYSTPPDPLAGFKGPTFKGRGGDRGKGWEGKEREETIQPPFLSYFKP